MKIFFLVVVALYILYLIFLIVRACSELKNMPYSGSGLGLVALVSSNSSFHRIDVNLCPLSPDLRLKFLTALTFVVLIIR